MLVFLMPGGQEGSLGDEEEMHGTAADRCSERHLKWASERIPGENTQKSILFLQNEATDVVEYKGSRLKTNPKRTQNKPTQVIENT
jgi:hypothetical protein